ncbi:MAG: copper resistance protein CopC [Pseudolabrys sp.]
MPRPCLAAALAAVMLLALPAGADAHSLLERSAPARGSTVAAAPNEVALWFTEAIEPKFSSIVVRDAKGAAMQDGAATVDSANKAQLKVGLKPLPAGTYKVIWRVLSVDTHRSQGEFTFRVGR